MMNLVKSAFCLTLIAICVVGLSVGIASTAEAAPPVLDTTPGDGGGGAGNSCPPCYVPTGASGWSQYGSCIGGPSHCPLYYRTYRNSSSGQICRGQSGVPI